MHPPFGFALFYLRSVAAKEPYKDRVTGKMIEPVTTGQIYWGAVPFVVIQCIMVALVVALPADGHALQEQRTRRRQREGDGAAPESRPGDRPPPLDFGPPKSSEPPAGDKGGVHAALFHWRQRLALETSKGAWINSPIPRWRTQAGRRRLSLQAAAADSCATKNPGGEPPGFSVRRSLGRSALGARSGPCSCRR